MSLNTNNMKQPTGNNLGHPTVGAHISRLIGVVDLGVQERQPYKGKPKSPCGQILLTYELTDDFVEIEGQGSRPRWISKKENAFSSQNSNLTAVVTALDPGNVYGGDLAALARHQTPCMVTISPKTDPNTGQPIDGVRITGVSGLPGNFPVNTAANPPLVFDWDAPDMAAFDRLPEWVKEQIKKAHNFKGHPIEALIAVYDQQQAAKAAAAQGQPHTAGQASPGTQSAGPAPNPAPAVAQAQNVPVAPPGYEWDQATNTFRPVAQKPVEQVQTAPATPAAPPGWKMVNGQWVPDAPDMAQGPQTGAAPGSARPY